VIEFERAAIDADALLEAASRRAPTTWSRVRAASR